MVYEEVKKRRMKYKISQTKLAEASGYSKATISAWELRKSIPSSTELSKLDAALSGIIRDIEECIFDVEKKESRILPKKNVIYLKLFRTEMITENGWPCAQLKQEQHIPNCCLICIAVLKLLKRLMLLKQLHCSPGVVVCH